MPGLIYGGRQSLQPGQFVGAPRVASGSHGHGKYLSTSASELGHGVPPPNSAGGPSSFSHDRRSSEQVRPTRPSWDHSAEEHMSGPSASLQSHATSHSNGSSSAAGAALPQLTMSLPDLKTLEMDREKALASSDPRRQLRWAANVLKYVDRKGDSSKITETRLVQWVDQAIGFINKQAGGSDPIAEALYLRGDLQASGAFPTYLRKDLRSAFNDFELSARMGHAQAWFRIGRDYEVLGDVARAKVAYEHGSNSGDVGSVYRLGMAHLLGQLDITVNYPRAIALLKSAADKADIDTPQPAYIFGMLLAGEFSHVPVPAHLLQPERGSTESEARRRIERAAYFHFVPAQYKCGWCYEHARLDCPYDPLMSVQWYSLASQGGEVEADMALSKWFLCGAEGCFDVDESLAFTFADKAARKGLGSAEFALGYYYEVGVGVEQDLTAAKKWYKRAADHGNNDATERLAAIDKPAPQTISRRDHLSHVDTKLHHSRTLAKNRSTKAGRRAVTEQGNASAGNGGAGVSPMPSASHLGAFNDISRKKTMRLVQETAGVRGGIKRLAGRSNKLEGSEAGPPLTSTQISPAPMGLQNGASNAYPHRPPSSSGRVPSQAFNVGGPVPGPTGYGMPPSTPQRQRLSSTPDAGIGPGAGMLQSPPYHQQTSPPPSSTAHSHPSQVSLQSGSSFSSGTPSKRPDPVVYQTFAEMGFASSKTKNDKDCVVM
ncbi:HCP-like protein [Tilletiaria anomala UBC 951]|uniref:HCP-like protein n=1 Tax=Tilletiaria anomala (strain ATCC 24038 / CBS 436.72 / UBC 951) TaxID=1037660 RepID=A0A066WJQ9_TILAU|nr:HCP-like protein [Tilletiaria anomala UBC 951]KDN50865.1 HCP-like protein [Tilletiaria anomala UBC 951]